MIHPELDDNPTEDVGKYQENENETIHSKLDSDPTEDNGEY